ncbi:MAG: recombinase RecA [Chloroflexi bacterium]|nr:recombinase RecA [Chloroflexota bacterium]MDE2702531.1 recombinase RecA [Chloroflexota bacterium]MDE2937259.1 recombinase RecA [Chloroflexota bacterium]MXY00895.1 recombinase RecA [Chloroflexota bacterium]
MAKKDKEPGNAALDSAVASINKRFGQGAIMRLSEGQNQEVESISTGSLSLDLALGVGGIPRGRIVEIFGPESSGKTTLAQHVIAEAQRAGGYAAVIDAEHAFDPTYAVRCGVLADELFISQPGSGEEALEIADELLRSNAFDIIVIDSVAALTPRAELEGNMGDAHVGLQARLMSQALRKMTATVSRTNTAVVFINQLRERVGVMFGSPETTPGGRALKFYSSVRIDIRRIGALKNGTTVVGNRTRVRVVKNKVAAPFRTCEFDILYNEGISRETGLIDLGLEHGLITKAGAYLSYGDVRLGLGRERSRQTLKENGEIAVELETAIRQAASEDLAS